MHQILLTSSRNSGSLLNNPEHYLSQHGSFKQRAWGGSPAGKIGTKSKATRRDLVLGGLCPCCCGLCRPKTGWYDKFFAGVMATGMDSYEEAVRPYKDDLLKNIRSPGRQSVLEIGIGAAPNLKYLVSSEPKENQGLELIGVDPNPYMFDFAKERASTAGLPSEAIKLELGFAEELPIPDRSIDTIICTLVLCSVTDVAAAVQEMHRVLKPEGKAYFLEHVAAAKDRTLLRLGQKILNPLQRLLADGCHLDRNPTSAFQSAGFQSLELQTFDVPGLGVLGPHICGVATA